MLASGFPMIIVGGPEYIPAPRRRMPPVFGSTKHPASLGRHGADCWPEIWDDVLSVMFGQVTSGGEAIWSEDYGFFLDHNDYLEETYFTPSSSATRDESGIARRSAGDGSSRPPSVSSATNG